MKRRGLVFVTFVHSLQLLILLISVRNLITFLLRYRYLCHSKLEVIRYLFLRCETVKGYAKLTNWPSCFISVVYFTDLSEGLIYQNCIVNSIEPLQGQAPGDPVHGEA